MCNIDSDYRCGWDDGADDLSIDETDENGNDLPDDTLKARFDRFEIEERRDKGKGKAKVFNIDILLNGVLTAFTILSRGWPGSTHLHDPQRNRNAVAASNSIFVYVIIFMDTTKYSGFLLS